MNLLPLDQIRLDARSHASALGWIGLLYRRPQRVEEAERSLSRWQRTAVLLRVELHVLPYLVLIAGAGRWLLCRVPGLAADPASAQGFWFHAIALAIGLAIGLATGLAFSLAFNLPFGLAFGLAFALAVSLVGSLTVGPAVSLVFGLAFGLPIGLVFALDRGLADAVGLAVSLAGGLAGGLAVGLIGGLAGGLTRGLATGLVFYAVFLVGFLRLYYLPFHGFFLWPRVRAGLYRFHPVAWDDVCNLAFPGFDRLLVYYAERDSEAGEREINRLLDEYPSQRRAALRARAILVARRAAEAVDLSRLDEVLAGLPAGEKGFLRETPELRRLAHEITALQALIDTLDRPFLREPFAALLVREIERFEQQIAGFRPPLSTELRKAARRWLEIARRQLEAARATAAREPTCQVFRAGDPVDREREAFVLRGGILGELERQVMLAAGCPGLLVYGRRRMGKSTLLRNLEGFLPPQVQVVTLSMQEARAFTSLPDLVQLIARRMEKVVQDSPGPPEDLRGLETFLAGVQERLEAADRRLLFAIDEYENLDRKIGEGALPEDLLAVLRESIQTHRRIIWAFAGSHGIEELVHAPWPSYLVSVRTVEVTPFEPAETRLLLTEPLRHSSLWRDTQAEPPRFAPVFWGEGGIERVHTETGGWPHLVQLVAENAVDLLNDAGGTVLDSTLLDRALDRAVVRGNNVFLELLERESHLPGEWDCLRAFRDTPEQAPAEEAIARSLRRRRLVIEERGRLRLAAPLMARWLRQWA